jgi:hypothetical protein
MTNWATRERETIDALRSYLTERFSEFALEHEDEHFDTGKLLLSFLSKGSGLACRVHTYRRRRPIPCRDALKARRLVDAIDRKRRCLRLHRSDRARSMGSNPRQRRRLRALRNMRRFVKYSLLVIKQWESWVGIVALVLFAASRLRGHELLIPDWIWFAILAGLLYYATFEVYLAALTNVPKPGEINVAPHCVETRGGRSWSDAISHSGLRCDTCPEQG